MFQQSVWKWPPFPSKQSTKSDHLRSYESDEEDLSSTTGFHAKTDGTVLSRPSSRAICFAFAIFFVSIFFLALWVLAWKLLQTTVSLDCGHSLSEAQENQCKFDQFYYAWVPQACFPEKLHQEYLEKPQNATWFLHTDQSEVKNIKPVQQGSIEVIYASMDWRAQQCTYIWESLNQGLNGKELVVDWSADLKQSQDCARFFMDVFDLGQAFNPKRWDKQEQQFMRCRDLSANKV